VHLHRWASLEGWKSGKNEQPGRRPSRRGEGAAPQDDGR
jgi:hypothetical protein